MPVDHKVGDERTTNSRLRLVKKVVLPPRTQRRVLVRTKLQGVIVTEPKNDVMTKYSVRVMNSVHDVASEEAFPILLTNFSNKTVIMPKHMAVGYATTSPLALIEVQGKEAQELCGMHDLQPSDRTEITDQLRSINTDAFSKFSNEEVNEVLFGTAPTTSVPPRAGAGRRATPRQAFVSTSLSDACLAI